MSGNVTMVPLETRTFCLVAFAFQENQLLPSKVRRQPHSYAKGKSTNHLSVQWRLWEPDFTQVKAGYSCVWEFQGAAPVFAWVIP